jgi:hypothetical protein
VSSSLQWLCGSGVLRRHAGNIDALRDPPINPVSLVVQLAVNSQEVVHPVGMVKR